MGDLAGSEGSFDGGFEDFYAVQYPMLVRLLMGMTGSVAVAEDLAQDALVAAHRSWSSLQDFDRPDLWTRRVATNRAISRRRRLVAEVAALGRVRARTSGSVENAHGDERVWDAVRALPRTQAAAIVLWAVEGLTHAEIGEVLACSAETARTHTRRARERLAKTLGGSDGG